MLITRKLINQSIKFHDYGSNHKADHYDYKDLSKMIDAYKNLLVSKNARHGMSVVIGEKSSTSQIAMVFACAELGLTITIVNDPFPAGSNEYVPGAINSNLKLLLPIDFYILSENIIHLVHKHKLFNDIAKKTIITNKETLDYTTNDTILATESSTLLKCLTSGTTGTPKVINHTHAFLYELINRNSKFYHGNMASLANLNHGSSPATYFLPGLISKDVKHYFNFFRKNVNLHTDILKDYNDILNHVMVPYTHMLDDIFSTDVTFKNCVFYTLSTIRKEWVSEVKKGKAKDIISIFGSNETSGPVLINQASDIDFTEDTYKSVDDFYKISSNDKNELLVYIPVYNKLVSTHDKVEILENKIRYIGRSNFYRINDIEIDIGFYQKEIKKYMNADLVVDTNKNRIYLAIWDDIENINIIKNIDELLKNNSQGLHYISKHECLNYQNFLSGIKLDNEALREYFRNKF